MTLERNRETASAAARPFVAPMLGTASARSWAGRICGLHFVALSAAAHCGGSGDYSLLDPVGRNNIVLPEVPRRTPPAVEVGSVAAMGVAQDDGQRICVARQGKQMHVIRHQAAANHSAPKASNPEIVRPPVDDRLLDVSLPHLLGEGFLYQRLNLRIASKP